MKRNLAAPAAATVNLISAGWEPLVQPYVVTKKDVSFANRVGFNGRDPVSRSGKATGRRAFEMQGGQAVCPALPILRIIATTHETRRKISFDW